MQTLILDANPKNIEMAAASLFAGELVAMPTETVYGLAGNAFDQSAITQIFAVKERPSFDPLIVHLPDQNWSLQALAEAGLIDPITIPIDLKVPLEKLISLFWPGPMTLVLPRHDRIPELVTSGLSTVALRVPNHPVAQTLLRSTFPLAAPSANRFGRISPTCAEAVKAELEGRIHYILDGGDCQIGLESTVLGIDVADLTLLRPGGLSPEQIELACGLSLKRPDVHPAEILAPGMLKSHYAPRHRMALFSDRGHLKNELLKPEGEFSGVLLLSDPDPDLKDLLKSLKIRYEALSNSGDLAEIAQKLFAGLRQLDQADIALIWAELPAQGKGLTYAVRDRLFKAAGQSE